MNNHDHVHGFALGLLSFCGGLAAKFLAHLQTIDALLYFFVLALSATTSLIGLRKLLKRRPRP